MAEETPTEGTSRRLRSGLTPTYTQDEVDGLLRAKEIDLTLKAHAGRLSQLESSAAEDRAASKARHEHLERQVAGISTQLQTLHASLPQTIAEAIDKATSGRVTNSRAQWGLAISAIGLGVVVLALVITLATGHTAA